MSTTRAWVIYSIVRLLSFIVPFAIVMLVLPGWEWAWLVGLVVATICGLAISEIFLVRPRQVIADSLARRRAERLAADPRRALDREEDALLDGETDPAAVAGATSGTVASETASSGTATPESASPGTATPASAPADSAESGTATSDPEAGSPETR